MRFFLILGSLLILSSAMMGQENKIKLEIVDMVSSKNNLNFCLKISNMSNQSIVTYLPSERDICFGLMKVKVVDIQNDKVHEFFPCTSYSADLDCLTVNCENSVCLNVGEVYIQKLKVPKKYIIPSLNEKKLYRFFVEWYLADVCFITNIIGVLKENIRSSEINVKI
jgi:hypothetical protein